MMNTHLINSCAALLCAFATNAGQLTGTFTEVPPGTEVNLTSEGTADWVHWGLDGDMDVNRKAGVGPQIGNYTLVTGDELVYLGAFQFTDNSNGYSWADGTPTPAVTDTTHGVYVFASTDPLGTGFELTVPADTRPRTLKLYLGVYSGEGTIQASLSDDSAPPYTSSFGYNPEGPSKVYSLNYAANTSSQTLRIRWILTKKQGGAQKAPNVNLQAAALITPGISIPPTVFLTSPSNNAQFLTGQILSLQASATDLDGTVSNVAFFANGVLIGETTNSPFVQEWVGAPEGFHTLTAVATDNAGEQTPSRSAEVFVHGNASVLTGNLILLPEGTGATNVDLSAEGTLDWIHWGYTAPSSLDRQSGVPPLIETFTHLGTNPVQQLTDSHAAWSWTGGTPNAENFYSTTGVSAVGATNGFEVHFAASPQGRRARVYFGLYGSHASVRAYLTDRSAPAFLNDSAIDIYGVTDGIYEVRYAAATPGGSLVIRYESTEQFDVLYGDLRLMSATVQPDDSVFLPLLLTSPSALGDDFVFSFLTQPNHTYFVEHKPSLAAPAWNAVTNLIGINGVITITNPLSPDPEGYYRVRAQ